MVYFGKVEEVRLERLKEGVQQSYTDKNLDWIEKHVNELFGEAQRKIVCLREKQTDLETAMGEIDLRREVLKRTEFKNWVIIKNEYDWRWKGSSQVQVKIHRINVYKIPAEITLDEKTYHRLGNGLFVECLADEKFDAKQWQKVPKRIKELLTIYNAVGVVDARWK